MVANPLKSTPKPTKQFTKQHVEKQKELRYSKALPKDKTEGSSAPYRFGVLTQLATSQPGSPYPLLRPSKSTREALREVLADAEVFMARILAESQEEDKEYCLNASQHAPCITFTPEDMQVRGNMIGPCTSRGILDRLK